LRTHGCYAAELANFAAEHRDLAGRGDHLDALDDGAHLLLGATHEATGQRAHGLHGGRRTLRLDRLVHGPFEGSE